MEKAKAALMAKQASMQPAEFLAAQSAYVKSLVPHAHWWGIKNISCGIFGIPLAFLVTYVVSMMTAPPSREMQEFIDSIRIPRGEVAQVSGQTSSS
jgi:Na+(H+)/acetate symporter ActP